ncbi:alpha/beta-Hydrolases superfamily protein [Striga hermonthica]|uniref:Alpha/beta-Hydrolases superfamily protein n=1 Tax=Striga hermonthica TaxID=68872 RepID=A0A9N7REV1_STRHE|nr:alpha/beta-Hydrolases superfamily protein [Striga hermonthica]
MASSVFSHAPSSSFTLHFNSRRPFSPQFICVSKNLSFTVKASTSVDYSIPSKSSPVTKSKPSSWQWKFGGNSVNIHFERLEKHDGGGAADRPRKDILLVPTISDVSTVEEWRVVAEEIVGSESAINWSATIVDWPGLGFSGRPKLDYNADVMERFLVDFVNAPDSPISSFVADNEYVVFGGGHGATIAVRATKKGLLTPKAIAAVAPTWAGPLPIVFALGWMMYNVLVSNEKAIQSQYKSHVYADPENVTREIIESRYELTKRKGARYVPAAFLTGLLDPVSSREEFLELFSDLQGKNRNVPVLVVSTSSAPKRSKAEMEALRGAKGVSKFVEVKGALLPQEEYPKVVAEELYEFLVQNCESKD